MELVATISARLFCLSVELTTNDSAVSAWWMPLLPALLASLLHATVVRPLAAAVATRHYCLKLQDTSCTCSTWLRRVTNQVLRILLSEQTSLWLLYLMAPPHLFDINVKLKVEVETTIRAMLHLLIKSTAALLRRLVTTGLLRVSSTADADADADAAAADDDDGRRQPGPGGRGREDGPRRSGRHRRPSVRVAGPEWDKRLRG
jgi:hypothetical protein